METSVTQKIYITGEVSMRPELDFLSFVNLCTKFSSVSNLSVSYIFRKQS